MMQIQILKSKIHRARITHAELDYTGSLSIDETFMKAAGIHEYEKILVANVSNGNRAETYVIKAEAGSKIIGLNGAMARLGKVGDIVILLCFGFVDESQASGHKPKVIVLDEKNKIIG